MDQENYVQPAGPFQSWMDSLSFGSGFLHLVVCSNEWVFQVLIFGNSQNT